MFRHLFCLVLVCGIYSLDGDVKQFINNPSIASQTYSTPNDEPLFINCTNPQTMANSSFQSWIKIWRINGSESFDIEFLTFVNNNSTLLFNQVSENDTGSYECCYHGYAYEDFICAKTDLQIDDSLTSATTSAAPPLDSWNVNITDGDFVNAQANSSYFIRLFYENITALDCNIQENRTTFIRTLSDLPAPLNSDILIINYNPAIHDGEYICNASRINENTIKNFEARFSVRESMDTNLHSERIPYEVVAPYLKSAYTFLIISPMILIIILNVF